MNATGICIWSIIAWLVLDLYVHCAMCYIIFDYEISLLLIICSIWFSEDPVFLLQLTHLCICLNSVEGVLCASVGGVL